ncbi:hypothetical protein [Lichenifustis flavocetrariae]|uniref:Uncharacterized protein n=1 Tax=Lichenifustis flavocetrariae TaxID=2949735 RepID=A0AA41YQW1_9HYPH|nr:hypothetical protein [Lichenifustis flavocetrariae]MCW6506884.1 hypothetical protein [Lichenifustis flavocetrariae]
MAAPANSTPMPDGPPLGAVGRIPCRVDLESEFLALSALRDRTTARLYELLDILIPPSPIRLAAAAPPRAGLVQAHPGVLLFKGGRDA